MKKPIIYPAVFYKDEDAYSVFFPDLPGCVTCGETIEEAYLMAGDVLHLWFECSSSKAIPPSNPMDIITKEGEFVSLVKAEIYNNGVDL